MPAVPAPTSPASWRVSRHSRRLAPSVIAAALREAAAGGAISLAAGCPATEALPTEETLALIDRVLSSPGALQYTDTRGLPALREWIAGEESHRAGRPLGVEQILVTHGSQQGLDLVCRALLDPGDTVLVDRPSYSGALQLLGLHQARVHDVPIAADPDLAALAHALQEHPATRLVYVVPSFANPTGASLGVGQRARLGELAERHGCVVVEDDPYRELRFSPPGSGPVAPVAAFSERVITLGSFSKVLSPAARTGYLCAPRSLAPLLGRLKEATDLGNSALAQLLVHAWVTAPGLLDHQLARLRGLYRERRDLLTAGVRAHLGEELSFTVPQGGFFLWARLTGGGDTQALLTGALREGVAFVPGAAFYAGAPDVSALRLSYAAAEPGEMAEGCARLARALGRLPAPARRGEE
ncbi:PLP-dependent aminotransferase family protein [Streptomyces sp. NPDC005423]|uniref:aminotransferase-like domain-containing protein n=1 Tax=Streptomyces sp. NPDC005423 TaxID=3155343 RepID=UPI0033B90A55